MKLKLKLKLKLKRKILFYFLILVNRQYHVPDNEHKYYRYVQILSYPQYLSKKQQQKDSDNPGWSHPKAIH